MGAGANQTDQTGPKAGWRERFLRKLAERANVSEACRYARITKGHVYNVRAADPDFAAAWDEALETAVDRLESKAWQRAEAQSDALMTLLLKAHRPEKYADRTVILKKIADEVKHASDGDLLRILGYDGPGDADQAEAGASGGSAARPDAAED